VGVASYGLNLRVVQQIADHRKLFPSHEELPSHYGGREGALQVSDDG